MRANEQLKDIKAFEKYYKRDTKTDEILNRGIHAFSTLKQINIKQQLGVLKSTLDNLVTDYDRAQLEYAKDLSALIFAAMIVKRGILATEIFETVTYPLEMLFFTLTKYEDKLKGTDYTIELQKEIGNISKSLYIWSESEHY